MSSECQGCQPQAQRPGKAVVTHSVCSAAPVCQVPPGLEAAEGTESKSLP